ncbi:hypothetical protein ACOME3_001717 [Neoechinorhynchus agilis]
MPLGSDYLKKYGWKEGDGLGKELNGIRQPIRTSLKADRNGIGYRAGPEEGWWDKIYDQAMSEFQEKVKISKSTFVSIQDESSSSDEDMSDSLIVNPLVIRKSYSKRA